MVVAAWVGFDRFGSACAGLDKSEVMVVMLGGGRGGGVGLLGRACAGLGCLGRVWACSEWLWLALAGSAWPPCLVGAKDDEFPFVYKQFVYYASL